MLSRRETSCLGLSYVELPAMRAPTCCVPDAHWVHRLAEHPTCSRALSFRAAWRPYPLLPDTLPYPPVFSLDGEYGLQLGGEDRRLWCRTIYRHLSVRKRRVALYAVSALCRRLPFSERFSLRGVGAMIMCPNRALPLTAHAVPPRAMSSMRAGPTCLPRHTAMLSLTPCRLEPCRACAQ